MDRDGGIELEHILQKSAWSLHLAGAVDCEVLTDSDEIALAYLNEFVVGVHAGRETLEVALLDDAFIFIITK